MFLSQYFLYIPRGLFITLPGDTISAVGCCFEKKEPLAVPKIGLQEFEAIIVPESQASFYFLYVGEV